MSDELVKACSENNYDAVDKLIDSGADIDHIGIYKYSALMISAREGNTEIVDLLIRKGAKIDLEDGNGRTAFNYASGGSDKIDILELLFDAGADIDHLDKDNNTPLMHAINLNCNPAVNFLIKKNANINIQNSKGNTALMLAVSNPSIDRYSFKLMVNKGANLNTQNNDGNTALLLSERDNTTRFLIQSGIDLNIKITMAKQL